MIYFTSDLHLYHRNIIEYAHRPFNTSVEMSEIILDNINKEVNKDDFLFILGDFCFLSVKQNIKQLKRIRCNNIVFTQGNHDQRRFISRIREETDKKIVTHYINERPMNIGGTTLLYNHIPVPDISKIDYINLHGHIHTEGLYSITKEGYYDVGVDNNEFKPVSMSKIREINNF